MIEKLSSPDAVEEELMMTKFSVDSCSTAIFWIRRDASFCYVNDAAVASYGYSRDELLSMKVHQIDPDYTAEVWPEYWQRMQCEKSITFETQMRCKDGTLVPVEIRTNLLDFKGQEFVFAFVTDISTRKKAEQDSRQHREMLAHVARLSTMGELVAGIAHELKQPLYAISNYATAASLLLGGADTPQPLDQERSRELMECHDGIRKSSQRANETIRALRDFARRGSQRRESVDINTVIRDAVNLVAFKERQCEVTLEMQLTETSPAIDADRIQCEQVVVNLLNNAYEAVAARDLPRHVVIRTAADRDMVELQVEDNGPGISETQAGKLFEAFFTTKENGMGMGLAISRTIVEDHGGRLRGSPNDNGGATFFVKLPVAVEPRDLQDRGAGR